MDLPLRAVPRARRDLSAAADLRAPRPQSQAFMCPRMLLHLLSSAADSSLSQSDQRTRGGLESRCARLALSTSAARTIFSPCRDRSHAP